MDQQIYELSNSNKQAVGMLKASLTGKAKDEVQSLAEKFTDIAAFEKEGCLWVGWYGFKFSDTGGLIDIETGESYNEAPVCDANL